MKENNTGNRNTGYWNTGYCNTDNRNTGNWNTGNRNTGNRNTGNWNTGDWNTGNRNAGYCNTGNWNTGNWNTGNRNAGNWNTGDRNTGDLNTTTPKLRLFNFDSDWEFQGELHLKLKDIISKYQRPLCEWISKSNMTQEEIEANPTCDTTGGYLKVNETMRSNLDISKDDIDFLRSVPHFDNDILKKCTGIDLEDEKIKVIIDGKESWISREAAEELKKAFCIK